MHATTVARGSPQSPQNFAASRFSRPQLGQLSTGRFYSQGLVFAYFFPLYRRQRGACRPLREGIEFGLLLGTLVYSVMVFATAAKFQTEPVADFLVLGTSFQLLQFLGVGAVPGLGPLEVRVRV